MRNRRGLQRNEDLAGQRNTKSKTEDTEVAAHAEGTADATHVQKSVVGDDDSGG